MKRNTKITLSALTAALSTAFMLVSYFPYLTYAIPAIAGLFMLMPLVETDYRYSYGAYLVSSVLILLFAEKEAAVLYVCFFGHYPITKAMIEKIRKPLVEWTVKILLFNVCVLIGYALLSFVFDIHIEDLGEFGRYSAYILLGFANIVFVVYDIAISRGATVYVYKIHPQIKKIMKN